MKRIPTVLKTIIASAVLLSFGSSVSLATEQPSQVPEQAKIVEHLEQQLELSRTFQNQRGESVELKQLFVPGRPLILAPVYYECPRLCTLTQEGLVKSLNELDLKIGEDYKVVSLSFNHLEQAELAAERAKKYHELMKDPAASANGGWDFLVGDEKNIREIMQEIGFSFEKDGGEYIHAAMLLVLTPEGKISRYLYGIDYPSKDMRLALVEAAKGKIGNTLDQVLLYCFRFDPTKGKYTLAVWNVTRLICGAGVLLLFGLLILFRIKEKRKDKPT